jgi:hypothetical protein
MNVPEELKAGRTWVCGGLGIGLPGLSFFTTYVPPLFPIISLITALPAAILLFVFALRSGPDRRRGGLPRDETRAAYFVAGGLTLVVLYLLLFLYTTIPSPTGERLQIGFGLSPWSLTEAGQSWVKSQPTITVVEMVKREAAFEQDRLFILWKSWSIYLAGVLVFLFYLLGFISWTSGFAFLAKRQSLPDKAAEG